jgi:hypothetical protein
VDAKDANNIGAKYRSARAIFGRAKRSEAVADIFQRAGLSDNLADGLISEFRGLLKNKKRSAYFNDVELQAMDEFVKGTNGRNALKLFGQLGVSHNGAMRGFTGMMGMQTFGILSLPFGLVSAKGAKSLTQAAATKIDQLVRSGADGATIAKAYLSTVPKAAQKMEDLGQLLLSHGKDLDKLVNSSNKVIRDAASLARGKRIWDKYRLATTSGAAIPAIVGNEQPQQQRPGFLN